MSAKHCGAPSTADQLACIAAYFSAAPHRRQQYQQPHGRLSLAWVATSPSARLVAEQHNAWVVLPFDTTALAGCPYADGDDEANAFGVALANATTPLFVLTAALGMDAAGKGSAKDGSAAVDSGLDPTTPSSPSTRVMSWVKQAAESLADVDHAASPTEPERPPFLGTSRAKPPPQKSARPSTGVRGPKVDDPLEAARSCGVHLGGLLTVLVSGVHLYENRLRCGAHSSPSLECAVDALTGAGDGSEQRINPSSTLLFSSTTCCGGSVSSLLTVPPNAAVYDAIPASNASRSGASTSNRPNIFREGAELHEDDGGAVDETAHDPQTAASVYTVQQVNKLHTQVRDGDVAKAYTAVWYRHVFLNGEEVTAEVLCGVSLWWLQRPVRKDELPTTKFSPVYPKSQNEVTSESSVLTAPPLYVKFMADIGANLWWPHRLLSVVRHRFKEHAWHSVALLRWIAALWMFCVVFVESVLHGVPEVPAHHPGSPHHVDLIACFRALGEVYGGADQLAALDVSHTSVRGVHLLSCAVGKVLGMRAATAPEKIAARTLRAVDRFMALDVAGCIQLHHQPGETTLLEEQLNTLQARAAEDALVTRANASSFPLPLVDILMAVSLHNEKTRATRSATGLAMALLSHHGSLTWLSGAGCSIDNAALHELGMYALLAEAVGATRPSTSASASGWTCSICAMDLTSALSLDDLNPAAYLVKLEQLLVPFAYITDDGIALLDGHAYPRDLSELLALCTGEALATLAQPAQDVVVDTVKSLQQLTTTASDGAPALLTKAKASAHDGQIKSHSYAVEALHQRFRSHLYQIDFTYCSVLSSVNGLIYQQRLELLNLSQTRINKAGLFAGADRMNHWPSSTSSSAGASRNPPLRLFIAEMCEHLNDLSGLAHINTLECVIVRSGSLGDDGLRSICTKDMRNLQLMDLSYCDRLHHIGCLANLPALETLILDSTDVLPAEVRQLRSSRSLATLSLRFCTEFAFIGKDRKDLEDALGGFPSLKHYVYEDLVGDDELRTKKTE